VTGVRSAVRSFRQGRVHALCAAVLGALALACGPVQAQQSLAPGQFSNPLPERRGGGAPQLPELQPTAPPPPETAPPAKPPRARVGGSLSAEPAFILKAVKVTGNTVLDKASIDKVVAPFLNQPIGLRQIEEIRQGITLLYVNRGYINSGAIIPDQTVSNGTLDIQVIEGRLIDIDLTGNRHFRTSYLTDRLWRGVTVPFDINALARQQQILLQDPLLSRMNLNVEPGRVPGEARVTGTVTEASPYSLTAQIADDQSPTVGSVRGALQGVIGNLLGVGDVLALEYGRSRALNDGAISYSVPISSDDTRVSVRYDINTNQVITASLSELNITSNYQSVALGLTRPFYRTPEQNLTLGLTAEWRRSQSFLLGEPFSFVAGADNGRTNVTALRFHQSWLDQDAQHVLALRSTFSVGLDLLGATLTPVKPSGQFFVWLGQAQYVRRVFGDWEFLIRGNLQLSANPLFPIEQFVLGGLTTVRGYREYLTAADNAFTSTIELRIPVGRVPVPRVATTDEDGTVQVVPFFDHGSGWNTRRPNPPYNNLSTIGVGLRWLVKAGILAEIYYGYGFPRVDVGNSLEDKGVYFRIVASTF